MLEGSLARQRENATSLVQELEHTKERMLELKNALVLLADQTIVRMAFLHSIYDSLLLVI